MIILINLIIRLWSAIASHHCVTEILPMRNHSPILFQIVWLPLTHMMINRNPLTGQKVAMELALITSGDRLKKYHWRNLALTVLTSVQTYMIQIGANLAYLTTILQNQETLRIEGEGISIFGDSWCFIRFNFQQAHICYNYQFAIFTIFTRFASNANVSLDGSWKEDDQKSQKFPKREKNLPAFKKSSCFEWLTGTCTVKNFWHEIFQIFHVQ